MVLFRRKDISSFYMAEKFSRNIIQRILTIYLPKKGMLYNTRDNLLVNVKLHQMVCLILTYCPIASLFKGFKIWVEEHNI
jgi:hypothetical protein